MKFWEDIWMGDKSFTELFPRLYYIFEQQNVNIASVGVWS